MTKPWLSAAFVAALVPVVFAQGHAPQNESIRQEDLRADLFFLAGDSMRGRLTDTEENRATADFIRSRFERMGLKPAGPGGSYFQPYNLMVATLGEGNGLDVMGGAAGDGAARHLREGQEFYPHRVSASGRAAGPVVFAGFGISAPHLQYDDLTGNLQGQIVLVLDHEPGERDPASPFDGVVTSEPSTAWRKALAAQEKGAVAVLFVADVHNHPGAASFEAAARGYWPETPPRILNYTLAAWADRIHIPVAQISPALAASLVAGTKKTLEELSKSAETGRGLTPLPLPGVRVELRTAVDRHIVPDRNVVALMEGSDPRLKDEWVIVSAHYDHNGADATQIFNGADDNGSGTVALVEIAEAYALAAKDGRRPKRSVLFAAWNSEERGLLGAWAYTEQPLAPLTTIAAVLNMDMIGRNEEIPVGGGARFTGFEVQTRGVEQQRREPDGVLEGARHHRGGRKGEQRPRPGSEEALRQQQLEPGAAQRSVAVPAARRARDGVHDRPASRLPHAVRPAREDQLREDGKNRAAGAPGELGHRERRDPAEAAGGAIDHTALIKSATTKTRRHEDTRRRHAKQERQRDARDG